MRETLRQAALLLFVLGCAGVEQVAPPSQVDLGPPRDSGLNTRDFGPPTDGGPTPDAGPVDAGPDVGTADIGPLSDRDVMGSYSITLTTATTEDPPGVGASRARLLQLINDPGAFVMRLIGYQLAADGDTATRDLYFDVCTDSTGDCLGAGDLTLNANGLTVRAAIAAEMDSLNGSSVATALAPLAALLDTPRSLGFGGTVTVAAMPDAVGDLGDATFTYDTVTVSFMNADETLPLGVTLTDDVAASLSAADPVSLDLDAQRMRVPWGLIMLDVFAEIGLDAQLGPNVTGWASFFSRLVDCDTATPLTTACEDMVATMTQPAGLAGPRLTEWFAAAGVEDGSLTVALPPMTTCPLEFTGARVESIDDCAVDLSWGLNAAPSAPNVTGTGTLNGARQ